MVELRFPLNTLEKFWTVCPCRFAWVKGFVLCGGLGLAILSTSKGVMSDSEAIKNNLGGEVICRVF